MIRKITLLLLICLLLISIAGCSDETVENTTTFTANVISTPTNTPYLVSNTATPVTQTPFLQITPTAAPTTQTPTAVLPTVTSTAKPTPTPVSIPTINSPFKVIEYVDCSYAENCPADQISHVDSAGGMYDPISKKVICKQHFIISLLGADKEYDISSPTFTDFLFKQDKFAISVFTRPFGLYEDRRYSYFVDIKNNTYEKFPYSFHSINANLTKGSYCFLSSYTNRIYDFKTGTSIEIPNLNTGFDILLSISPQGKFAYSSVSADPPYTIIVDIQKENGIVFKVEPFMYFIDDERYIVTLKDDKIKLYDTSTGKDVTGKAQPANPYLIRNGYRYDVIKNKKEAIPNLNNSKGFLEKDGYVYFYKTDGYIYRTEIATFKQDKFQVPSQYVSKLNDAINNNKIDRFIIDIDSRTNGIYLLAFLIRPHE